MVQGSLAFFPRLLERIAVPLLTFYMLLDGPRLAREARGFLSPSRQGDAGELMKRWHRILLEYVRGQTLEQVLAQTPGAGLPLDRVRRIGRQITPIGADAHGRRCAGSRMPDQPPGGAGPSGFCMQK